MEPISHLESTRNAVPQIATEPRPALGTRLLRVRFKSLNNADTTGGDGFVVKLSFFWSQPTKDALSPSGAGVFPSLADLLLPPAPLEVSPVTAAPALSPQRAPGDARGLGTGRAAGSCNS